jgi:stage II sporulation protein AA (anti-sigma F factor antagonist)
MTEVQFHASSERLSDETRVVRVTGELDLYTATELERALRLAGAADGRVVVDLRECTFIDSTGLGILVAADRRSGGNGLLIVASSQEVLRAFEVGGIHGGLTLHRTLESALNGAAAA